MVGGWPPRRERLWGGTGGGDGNQEAQEVMWTEWASSGDPGTQSRPWAIPGEPVGLEGGFEGRKDRQVRRFYSPNSGSGLEEEGVSFEVLLFSQKHGQFRSSG